MSVHTPLLRSYEHEKAGVQEYLAPDGARNIMEIHGSINISSLRDEIRESLAAHRTC